MQEKSVLTGHLSELKQKIENGLEELKSSKELYEFKSEYLEGKKSKISGLMKEMKNIAPEERANYGKSVNELKEWALGRFQKVEEEMKERELQKKYESEKIDLTLPAEETAIGNLHPVTLIRKQLIDIFAGMGFEVYEGREIETDYYNFTALNTPQDHPARDMQDTFYLSPGIPASYPDIGQARFMSWKTKSRRSRSFPRDDVFRSDDRRNPFSDVPSDGGTRCRQKHHPLRPERNARRTRTEDLRRGNDNTSSSILLPVHGAVR